MTDPLPPRPAVKPTLSGRLLLESLVLELARSSREEAPELYSPFEPGIHPDTPDVQEASVTWAREMGLAPDPRRLKALRDSKIAWLAARAFPTAETVSLQLAADWTTLFCLLDDRTEKIDGIHLLEGYLETLLDVLRGHTPVLSAEESPSGARPDPIAMAFSDLGRRLRAAAPSAWFAIFMTRVEELFSAFGEEARHRGAGTIPEFSRYLGVRAVTVGLPVLFEFFQLTNGVELPDQVRHDPAVQRLAATACNIVGWANDLYTYRKEITAGEIHNLVVVGVNEFGMSLDEAIDWCIDLHDTEVRTFEVSLADLPVFGGDADLALARYAGMLRSWVRGHLDWAHETGRYVTADGNPPSSQRWEGFIATRRRQTTPPAMPSRAPSIPPPASVRTPSIPPPGSVRVPRRWD